MDAPTGIKCNKVYELVERKIGGIFATYGRFVARNAWQILIASIIVNGGFGIGMMNLKLNSDASSYLPTGTEAEEDLIRVESIFPYVDYENFNPLQLTDEGSWARVIVRSKDGNLLTRSMLEEVRELATVLRSITAVGDNGGTISFLDICAEVNNQCYVDGDVFWDSAFLSAVDNGNVTYPEFNASAKGTVSYASDIGGIVELDDTGRYLKRMQYLRLEIMIPYEGSEQWLGAFESRLEQYTSDLIDIAFGHYYSLGDELKRNLSGDISLFAGTIVLMSLYACIATLSSRITDQVGQRVWLGIAGVLAAGLAILSSIGFCSALGISFVSIAGIVPFLIIGIGIDDMFILLSGLSEAQTMESVEDKMAETLRISGVGVTITSLTDFIAFMAGAASSFLAVKNFCIYTGVAVLFCYINNITFFAACVAINERRVDKNRHFITCRRLKSKSELLEKEKSGVHVFCCGGSAPANRDEAESFIDKFPRWLIPKIVLNWSCKMIVMLLFIHYIAVAIYGCVNLKHGMLYTQLVSDDSYFYKYSDWNEKYFVRKTVVSFVIQNIYEYSSSDTQTLIDTLITSAQSSKYFDDTFEENWLKSYTSSQYYLNTSEAAFISGLSNFFTDENYAMFENDVVIDSANQRILASRVYLLSTHLADSQEEGKLMLESRALAGAAALDCFAYSPAFHVSELYVRILGQTLQSVGIALAAVFVITCIFMPHPILIPLVTVAVISIMVGVFGFMLYLNVSLSAVSMILLIMSIGFSVDFTSHICHGYMISDGETRDIRVRQAIDKTGAPIFHGAVSSLLGVLVLAAAKSYIFRSFASVMSFVLLFGITHALFLLPVILSWIGPGRMNSVDANPRRIETKTFPDVIPMNETEQQTDNGKTD